MNKCPSCKSYDSTPCKVCGCLDGRVVDIEQNIKYKKAKSDIEAVEDLLSPSLSDYLPW